MSTQNRTHARSPWIYSLAYVLLGTVYVAALINIFGVYLKTPGVNTWYVLLTIAVALVHVGLIVRASKTMRFKEFAWAYVLLAVMGACCLFLIQKFPSMSPTVVGLMALVGMGKVHQARLRRIGYLRKSDAASGQRIGHTRGESTAINFTAEVSSKSFASIYGMEEVKARVRKAAEEIIADSQGKNHGKAARNGILLFGEPGNGKTAFPMALAGEMDLPIMTVTYGMVASEFVNETTKNVVKAFRDAEAQAPCILFFDEIDSLLAVRSNAPGVSAEKRDTTNSILTELVAIRGKGVLVMAATNDLSALDKAGMREKRFDYKIEITPPDETARIYLLRDAIRRHLPGVPLNDDAIVRAARRWDGFSVARILTIAEELGAMHQERPFSRLSLADMMRALRTVQGRKGSIPADTKDLSELILPEELREQLQTIAARMRDIERVEKLGGTVPTGLLFYGEPGTGKTECGRALAKATDWAFLQTTGNDLINDNAQLDKLYAEAKDIRPCIFFIDEADDILASREYSPYKSLTNKLLTIMDGGSGKVRDIVFIAATNHPDSIDKAALRGGRFTEKLFFEYPDASGVAKFVRTWMKKSPATFAAELSPDTIAGMIGADSSIATVSAILQEAVNRMIGRSTDSDCQVSEKDLRAAITTVKGRY